MATKRQKRNDIEIKSKTVVRFIDFCSKMSIYFIFFAEDLQHESFSMSVSKYGRKDYDYPT